MSKFHFQSFRDARDFAREAAVHLQVNSTVERCDSAFVVGIEGRILPETLHKLSDSILFNRIDKQLRDAILELARHFQGASSGLAWLDDETGLTWDTSRLICGIKYGEFPWGGSDLLNAIEYSELSGWRLPTLSELKTLTPQKLLQAGVDLSIFSRGGVKLWSSESSYDGNALVDIEAQLVAYQHFKEHDKNWTRPGDGYREYAQTMLVTSNSVRV